MKTIIKSIDIRKAKTSITTFALALLCFACTDGFEMINTSLDPEANINDTDNNTLFTPGIGLGTSITDDEMKWLQANIENAGTIFRQFSYEGVYDDYQRTTNLTHDIYAGYFANLSPSFLYLSPTYRYNEPWSVKRWDHFYQHRTVEYSQLVRAFWFLQHDFENKKGTYLNAFYITRIYYAFLISMQTDSYGDIPLTDKHLQGIVDAKSPAYRTQKEVYQIIFQLLDDALTNIDPTPAEDAYNLGENDRCYGGDVRKWIRFGNTLRLRLALRISGIDPEWARREGEAAMAHPGGLINSQTDNMRTIPKYAPVELGGENSSGSENIYTLCSYTWGDSGLNDDLDRAYRELSTVRDPRCAVCWFRPLDPGSTPDNPIESSNDFLGSKTGDDDIQKPSYKHSRLRSHGTDTKTLRDDAWFGLSRESVWLSYAETLFLLAEAALRGWQGATLAPIDYFLQGISASMGYYKIPEAQINEYIEGLHIITGTEQNPFDTNDKEGMLEQIITHKWLALFPNGNEGWAEFRRTDYPKFVSLPLINSSGGEVEDGKFIQRISYPSTEGLNSNFPFGGGLKTDVRMWWDITEKTKDSDGNWKKPTNFSAIRAFKRW